MAESLNYYAGRAAAYLAIAVAIATALLPIIADTDWESTVGIIGGATAILVVIREYMAGASKHEARLARGAVSPEGANYIAGRIATYLGIAIGIATAAIPILGNTDWTTTAGILAGAAAAIAAIQRFVAGAQNYEGLLAGEVPGGIPLELARESRVAPTSPNAPR